MILRRLTQHSTDDSSFLCPEVVVTNGAPSVVIEDLHSPFRLVVAPSTEANLYIIGHCPRLKKKATTIFPCFCHKFIDRNFVLLVLNGRRNKCVSSPWHTWTPGSDRRAYLGCIWPQHLQYDHSCWVRGLCSYIDLDWSPYQCSPHHPGISLQKLDPVHTGHVNRL